MFSRRHPFLFSLLVFSGIVSFTVLGVALLIYLGTRDDPYGGFGGIGGDRVGIVEVGGIIADSRDVVENLRRFREDERIKAIVLRIDSPGGVVGPAQEIYREVGRTVQEKKVFASMGAVAASGGYYVAAAANGIMANPGTITGSIGVIMEFTNVQELLSKIGLSPVVVKSGDLKDVGSPVREMSEADRRFLQDFVGKLHRQFIADIASGRKMDIGAVEKIADGRILTGQEAQGLGLVDRIGNLEDAIAWAGESVGIEGRPDVVYPPERRLTFLRSLMASMSRILLDTSLQPRLKAAFLYSPEQ
ncbi:MAG: signal peptide peptidase SppA [Desulfobacterales bacterium]